MEKGFLEPKQRAEDILLGNLGFGEEASIVTVEICEAGHDKTGYKGTAVWKDGEVFEFHSDEELSELEAWALGVLTSTASSKQEAA